MSLSAGEEIEVRIEKPASGGRMIARHDGQVVLVLGGIPGERALTRINRVERRLAFGTVSRVIEPSPDRREAPVDPLCGGCLYAHIDYRRQVAIKGEVIADALARIGRYPLPGAVRVAPSQEDGYRLRARLHIQHGKAGFFREGTHELCAPEPTGQLLPESMRAITAAVEALASEGAEADAVEISENVAADQRALHLHLIGHGNIEGALASAMAAGGLSGCSGRIGDGPVFEAGHPIVTDPIALLIGGAADGTIQRRPSSFFQGNRYLLPALVQSVVKAVPEGPVLDLYAGVGLFAVALAASGRTGIVAVEGDRISGADLRDNVQPWGSAVRAVVGSVEEYLARQPRVVGTVLVDPPRTGLSKEALDAVVRRRPERLVYVSCDPPTMARDARRLLDAGYRLDSVEGFDFFPNTPHVEVLAVFEGAGN
jgi:23S rRNA (uracil1939-C5)-methyltransferase